jgi:NET1-associated nuclear protein 1 (U3 small nucleolar RNA-associated protein 17)
MRPPSCAAQCCAISSDESMIAAGDASGRIQIWRNFGQHVPLIKRDGQSYVKPDASMLRSTTVHWHASAVNCLSFSPDGTYLMSGGREGVLVLWQVETGSQNFLPRLGGPLTGIQPSPVDPAR